MKSARQAPAEHENVGSDVGELDPGQPALQLRPSQWSKASTPSTVSPAVVHIVGEAHATRSNPFSSPLFRLVLGLGNGTSVALQRVPFQVSSAVTADRTTARGPMPAKAPALTRRARTCGCCRSEKTPTAEQNVAVGQDTLESALPLSKEWMFANGFPTGVQSWPSKCSIKAPWASPPTAKQSFLVGHATESSDAPRGPAARSG